MRYATLLAKAALALALPFILAHCASLLSERLPLKYDATSVGGPECRDRILQPRSDK